MLQEDIARSSEPSGKSNLIARFIVTLPTTESKRRTLYSESELDFDDENMKENEVQKLIDEKTEAFERIVGLRGRQLFIEWEREKVSLCAAIDSCFDRDVEMRAEAHAIREHFESSSRAVTARLIDIISAHSENKKTEPSYLLRDIQESFQDEEGTRDSTVGKPLVQTEDSNTTNMNATVSGYDKNWSKRNRQEFDSVFSSVSQASSTKMPGLSFKPFVAPSKRVRQSEASSSASISTSIRTGVSEEENNDL
jgi:hypothetical protein